MVILLPIDSGQVMSYPKDPHGLSEVCARVIPKQAERQEIKMVYQ